MTKLQTKFSPTARKTYTDPPTGAKKQGAIVPLAKIRADEIWAKIRPYLEQHEILGNRLVVAIFKTSKIKEIQTASGDIVKFELPDEFIQEDVWQGVTGMVVQKGPGAFVDSDKWKFHGQSADIGDWVTFQPANTILQKFGTVYDGIEVRVIQDCYLIAKVAGPHVMEERIR